jgi:hypothetical protein
MSFKSNMYNIRDLFMQWYKINKIYLFYY